MDIISQSKLTFGKFNNKMYPSQIQHTCLQQYVCEQMLIVSFAEKAKRKSETNQMKEVIRIY